MYFNPLALRDFVKMAYYSLEDVEILLSFWHRSKQYEIAPFMFIFVNHKLNIFASIHLDEENGVSQG